ncbi:hypothetical protein BGZ97_005628 [Linnemannia gamsii]|uniref:Tyr recombinase domain-containing protein n=1 Tax=Linnemannia gamsii TaxID=64522 RepID=A0A9P6QQP0_9FUNG|nr:hypothetical protein BGZ97_005628 [Linnemannia gamsii]
MDHWHVPDFGLRQIPSKFYEFELNIFFTFSAKERALSMRAAKIPTAWRSPADWLLRMDDPKSCPSLSERTVSPHQLRHSCAILMLQATRDIRKVALWLGHADICTTEIYLRVDPSEKLEAVEAVLPPGLRRGRFKAPDALIASLFDPG